jgi:hypothetical protein
VERAAELYGRGMSLREVAAHLGATSDTIRWHLRQAGVTMRPPGRPKATKARARPRQWREILTDALARQVVISVRSAVSSHLRRTPTRAEITAARRAAHGLAASGQATILRVRPPRSDGGGGSAHLILARPGATMQSGLLDEVADMSSTDKAHMRFEPTVMAHDLAASVELLAAAIEAIPADRLNQSDAERLVASLDASFDALRRIRSHLRRAT